LRDIIFDVWFLDILFHAYFVLNSRGQQCKLLFVLGNHHTMIDMHLGLVFGLMQKNCFNRDILFSS
jgi:hypothetical protein